MKGRVVANLGEARYTVAVATENTLLDAERARVQTEYDQAQALVTSLLGTVATLEDAYESALWDLYGRQDDYQTCLSAIDYDAALDAEESACEAARSAAYARCADQYEDLPSIMVCRARADAERNRCLVGAPQRAANNVQAAQNACFQTHRPLITTAQTRVAGLLASFQAGRERLRREQARVTALGMRRTQLGEIADRVTQYTVFSAQNQRSLAVDDEVEIATTPAGRHVVTAIVAQGNCRTDARVLPSYHLFINAAIYTGAETWRPTWRTGTVQEVDTGGNRLTVQFDPATMTGSLGTDKSRREIDCTPPQAYFDGNWQDVEDAIAAAQTAVEDAQDAARAARAELTAAIAAADATRDTSVEAGDQNCVTIWDAWKVDCLQVNDPPECQEGYETNVNLCKQEVRDAADLIYQAALATAHGVHDPLISAADEAVTEAIAALRVARSRILGPAAPLVLSCPVEHCHARSYQVGDSVLVDFPERNPGAGQPLAVWESRRVIGWADDPRACSLRLEPGLLCLPPVRADIVYPVHMQRPSWLTAWAAGPGVGVPGAEPPRSTLLLGELAAAPELEPPYDWPEGADYEGLLYDGAAAMQRILDTSVPATRVRYPATPYTGLARTWAEGCLAAGQALGDLLPDGCSADPGRLAVWISPPDPESGLPAIWVADVSASGVIGWRASIPALLAPTARAWAAGDYSGDAAHLALLWVLAYMVVDGPQTVLVGGDDIAPAYDGTGSEEPAAEYVWVEDAVPAGASTGAVGGDAWEWVSASPAPHSGSLCHRSAIVSGYAQHGWYNAPTQAFGPSDALTQWVWIDPDHPTQAVMLEIRVGTGYYRPYWGADVILPTAGNRVRIGDLPEPGAWAELICPMTAFAGWSGSQAVNGVWYTLYGGRVAWDRTARYTPGSSYGSGPAAPLTAGWTFTAVGGAIVTHRDVNPGSAWMAFEGAHSTLAVEWQDGVPDITVSVGSWARWRPDWGYDRLHIGGDGQVTLVRCNLIYPGQTGCATDAPVLCVPAADGSIRVLRYYGPRIYPGSTGDVDASCTCDGNTQEREWSQYAVRRAGGYGLSDPGDHPTGGGTVREWSQSRLTTQWGDWGQWNPGSTWALWTVGDNVGGCGQSWVDAGAPPDWPTGCAPLVASDGWHRADQFGAYSLRETQTAYAGASTVQAWAYMSAYPDAVWHFALSAASTWTVQTRTDTRTGILTAQRARQWRAAMCSGQPWGPVYGDIAEGQALICKLGWSASMEQQTVSGGGTLSTRATMHLAGSEIDASGGPNDWSPLLYGDGSEPIDLVVSAIRSARGSAVWQAAPGGDRETDSGIDADALPYTRTWAGG